MSRHQGWDRGFYRAIAEVLLNEWDPIGVAGIPEVADEYDSYALQLYGMLARRESMDKVTEYLLFVETERMGFAGERTNASQIAERLFQSLDGRDRK